MCTRMPIGRMLRRLEERRDRRRTLVLESAKIIRFRPSRRGAEFRHGRRRRKHRVIRPTWPHHAPVMTRRRLRVA